MSKVNMTLLYHTIATCHGNEIGFCHQKRNELYGSETIVTKDTKAILRKESKYAAIFSYLQFWGSASFSFPVVIGTTT